MKENLHSGHRKRLRERLIKNGIDKHTPEHEILEFLLFYCLPRKDTNELAHTLIKKFGSLVGVLDASEEALMQVEGISENSITLLKLIIPIAKRYMDDKNETPRYFRDMNEVGDYLVYKYFGYTEEVFCAMFFDGKGRYLGFEEIERGDLSTVGVSTRKVIEAVIKYNAGAVIVSHNHPSGIALPSRSDLVITQNIKNALSHINVMLLDHIIVSDDDFVSLVQTERYSEIFKG